MTKRRVRVFSLDDASNDMIFDAVSVRYRLRGTVLEVVSDSGIVHFINLRPGWSVVVFQDEDNRP